MSTATKLDITLLQVMKVRTNYNKFIKVINNRSIEQITAMLINKFGKFFELMEDCEVIPVTGAFYTWFAMQKEYTQEQLSVFKARFNTIEADPDPLVVAVLQETLLTADAATKVADLLLEWQKGEDVDLIRGIEAVHTDFNHAVNRHVKLPFVDIDSKLLDDDRNNSGFRWAWPCLNNTMRPLRGGDFIIFAGRPDKGKTTAIADNVREFAKQLPNVYPNDWEERAILWFNNEGSGKRIMKRVIQSTLGIKTSEMVQRDLDGTLWQDYDAHVNNHRNAVRVLDIHGFKYWQVEEVIKKVKPAMVIFDMIDNVRFDGSVLNGGNRTDQLLEAMYQWARELGVIYDVPIIACSQLSAEAEGKAFPLLAELKDSRTGKQGTADAIITIGASNEASMAKVRYIGHTKNKLALEGKPSSARAEMIIDGDIGRFL